MIRGRRPRPKRWPIPKWQLRPKRQPKSRPFWSQHSIPARPDTTRHRKTPTRYHADLSCAPNPSGYASNSRTEEAIRSIGRAGPTRFQLLGTSSATSSVKGVPGRQNPSSRMARTGVYFGWRAWSAQKLNAHCQRVANLSSASALSAVLRTPPRGERPRRSESYRHASTRPP